MTAVVAGEIVPAEAGGALSTAHRNALDELIAGWLLEVARSADTRRAYRSDMAAWRAWCDQWGTWPLTAPRTLFSAWLRHMEVTPSDRTGRPLAEATLARRASTVASFYGFAVDMDQVERSPVPARGRPKAPATSTTVGLSRDEARALRVRVDPAAGLESARDCALMTVLLLDGLRSAEVRTLDVGSTGHDSGHVVMTVHGKGRKVRRAVMPAPVVVAIERMLAERAEAAGVPVEELDPATPLFVDTAGHRLSQQQVARIVRRVCRGAGIRSWAKITPHSLRHAFITLALDGGSPLHVVSDHVGHASTRTTQRYDRDRGALSRSPVHSLAAFTEPERES